MIELTAAAERKLLELRGDDPERAYVRLYVAGRTCCNYRYGLAFEPAARTLGAGEFGRAGLADVLGPRDRRGYGPLRADRSRGERAGGCGRG